MTLVEALAAHHRRGRIRIPWLPGMLGTSGADECRVLCGDHADGLIFIDLGGMRDWVHPDFLEGCVTSDPCTVGGLLAQLREAAGEPGISVGFAYGDGWYLVRFWFEQFGRGVSYHSTEGDAIAGGLIALLDQ